MTAYSQQVDSADLDRNREEEINWQLREGIRCCQFVDTLRTAYSYRTAQFNRVVNAINEADQKSWLTWLLHRRREINRLKDALNVPQP